MGLIDWFRGRRKPKKFSFKPHLSFILNMNIGRDERENYIHKVMTSCGCKKVAAGGTRLVYLTNDGKYVIKFPRSGYGITVNADEHRIWHKYKNSPDKNKGGILYAPCRLVHGSILVMKALAKICGESAGDADATRNGVIPTDTLPSNVPGWCYKLDCEQVGYLPDGRLVAYDYGDWLISDK